MKGKLYIHFSVDFPESGFFSTEQCKVLTTILPSGPRLTEMDLDDCEETILENVNMEEELRRKHFWLLQIENEQKNNDVRSISNLCYFASVNLSLAACIFIH